MTRHIIQLSVVVACALAAQQVRADTRVAIDDFRGPSAERLRDAVVSLLERQSSVTIISQGQLERSAKKLGVDMLSFSGRLALARELQLSAWMEGVVERRSNGLKLTLGVYDGAQHALIGETALSARSVGKLSAEIREHLWRKSRRALLDASELSAKAEPEPTTQAPAPAPLHAAKAPIEREADLPDGRSSEWLRAFIGVGSPYRTLAFNERVSTSLGDHQLSGAPMIDIDLRFHPARPFTTEWISWLSVDARAQIAGSSPTTDRDGNPFKSSHAAYHVGLRGRIPIGDNSISLFSGYAVSRFGVSSETGAVPSPTPSVDYRMIRSGLGAELALSDAMRIELDGAWLYLSSVGEIGRWFPHAKGAGLEVAMFASYNVTQRIFARATAAYQRAFFDFNSQAGDKNIAGGATDQSLAMSIGAGMIL